MTPILYSFRRCPYAMRARLALISATQKVELRELASMREKPAGLLKVSPKGTVPVLVFGDQVIDQSLEIMHWALMQNDPEGWLSMPAAGHDLIAETDRDFKLALDRCKYASRYPAQDFAGHHATALGFLTRLDAMLSPWLFKNPSLADYAILPFVRQFAMIDQAAFDALPLPRLQSWLNTFLASPAFIIAMEKHDAWTEDAPPKFFPAQHQPIKAEF